MTNFDGIPVGTAVCESGYGMSNPIHRHGIIVRVTKLYVVAGFKDGDREYERRFHKHTGRATPYQPYSGVDLSTKCQRSKKKATEK